MTLKSKLFIENAMGDPELGSPWGQQRLQETKAISFAQESRRAAALVR
jgi:hypothetical protein